MKLDTRKSLLAALLIFLVVALRVVEHPINATPMVAVMLFSAAVFKDWRWKIGVPVVAMLLSDLLIELKNGYGFHSATFMVYSTFALLFIAGYFILRKINVLRIATASVVASTLFFLVTNFAFFYPEAPIANPSLGHYPHNLTGIIASYQAGLPFFKNMFVGDLMFSGILFGAYFLIARAAWFTGESRAV
ncbi:MAG: hypothetical protein LRY55_10565 [Leadbetterella sp.]|nr:hypothetical protein [Leadbetterella sp.]